MSAFQSCTSLRYIQIPDTVVSIRDGAFDHTSVELIIAGYAGSYAESYAIEAGIQFEDMSQWTKPDKLVGSLAEYYSGREEQIVRIPFFNADESCFVTSCKFGLNKNVKEIHLSPYQTAIDSRAFSSCSALVRVCTQGQIDLIGPDAFANCTALESAPLEHVAYIGPRAFFGCTSLEEIQLPESLSSIPRKSFSDCDGLTYVVLPSRLRTIDSSAFKDCDHLQLAIFTGGTVTNGDYLFYDIYGNTLLKTVYLSETVSRLNTHWIEENSSITDIWIYNPELVFNYNTEGGENLAKDGHIEATIDARAKELLEESYISYDPELAIYNLNAYKNLTVHGYAGSIAETWAKENQVNFAPIPDGETMPDPEDIIAAYEFTD